MDTRTSFTSIFIVWISICVCLVSGESVFNVSGVEGSTAVLPCELETVGTETLHIKWNRDSEIVFERKGNQNYQGEGYEDRVDVPEEELLKGNCSLVLRNLRRNDSDVYRSLLMVRRTKRNTEVKEISSVSLSVREKSEEIKYDPLAIIIPVIIVCGVLLICLAIYIWKKDQFNFSNCREIMGIGTVESDQNQQANDEYEMQNN